MQDKTGLFNSVKLEEIHSVVKENGRNIADNSLRLMGISDDVAEVKSITQQIQEDILEMRKISLNIQEITLEMRKNSFETNKLIEKVIEDIEAMKEKLDEPTNAYDKVI